MLVEESLIKKLRITDVERLDAIDVYIENMPGVSGKNAGKITITCFGRSWTVYFGAIGGTSIEGFFKSVDTEYIIGKFTPSIPLEEPDWDAFRKVLKSKASDMDLSDRDKDDVEQCVDQISDDAFEESYNDNGQGTVELDDYLKWEGLGKEVVETLDAGSIDVAMMPHHDFKYVSRIVEAVKLAL
jgi:hypothetical protein